MRALSYISCVRLGRTVAACAALAACAPGTARNSSGTAAVPCDATGVSPAGCGLVCRARIPIDFTQGEPLMTAWVGSQPVRMILDTGANGSGLSRDALTRLGDGIVRDESGHIFGIGGATARQSAAIPNLAFGNVRIPARRMDVLTFGRFGQETTPDGLLGADILSAFEVDVDMPHNLVTLYDGVPCGTSLPGWSEIDGVLPFDGVFRLPHVTLPVMLDGHSLSALLDTGSDQIVVAENAARGLGVPDGELATDLGSTLVGIGTGKVKAQLHQFNTLTVAGHATPQPETAVAQLPFSRPELILGETFFKTNKVWISYRRRTVAFAHTW